MRGNSELLACPGYDCDGCKVRHTCRRVRAEHRARVRRDAPTQMVESFSVALDRLLVRD
jgi:hypothetical protein